MKKLLIFLAILTINANIFCIRQNIFVLQKIKNAHLGKIFINEDKQIEAPFSSRIKIKNGYGGMDFYARKIILRDTDYPLFIEGAIYSGEPVMRGGFLMLSQIDPNHGPGISKPILLSKKELLKPKLKDLYIAILEKIKVKTKDKKIEKKVSKLIKKYKTQKLKIIREEKLYDTTIFTEK